MFVFWLGVYILVESLRPTIFHVTPPMSFRKAAVFITVLGLLYGCSSAPKSTRTPGPTPLPASALEVERIKEALSTASAVARSLYVEGDIVFEHDGESNNASFVM